MARNMKERVFNFAILWAAIVWGCAGIAGAESPRPLTTLEAIHALTNEQAALSLPVAFEGTVTYYSSKDVDLFVQDGDTAIYVKAPFNLKLAVGDRVLVEGETDASFRPEVTSEKITLLHHGVPPKPIPATYKQLIRAELDCRRVVARAVVRSANSVLDAGVKSAYLQLLMEGNDVDAEVFGADPSDLTNLVGAEVEVTGAAAGKFDSKMQMTGILLEVPSMSDVKILKPADADPMSLPVTPMDEIIKGFDVQDHSERMRVQGAVTYYQPGGGVVLQDGSKSVWVRTRFENTLQMGRIVSASGFPTVRNGSVVLSEGQIEDTGVAAPVVPKSLSATELATGSHAFDLVSVQGQLLMALREAAKDEYVLVSDGHLFSAVYRHPDHGANLQLPAMKDIPIGSLMRMTGICSLDSGDKIWGPVAFDVLLRSSDDIAVVAAPSLWSVRNLTVVVGMLLLVVLVVGSRSWWIERRVRRQAAELASMERRRSRILEDINFSKPLAEVIEEITELVSFRLRGAPCWCQLADGTKFGNQPKQSSSLRVVEAPVRNAAGSPHGVIYAALHRLAKPAEVEGATLSTAAELATLAIETRRLYSDLRRRSEFDLLTDIHNRFSLERRLEELLKESSGESRVFGLIYLDLDGFKEINDIHGHQIGDIYLQQVASRMKRQVRPVDMIARLGGDEFAVLVPDAINRAQVEEIGQRIERCFRDPFSIAGHQIKGATSLGIALYPEDGTTKDGLLNAADAAMYVEKHTRRLASDTFASELNG